MTKKGRLEFFILLIVCSSSIAAAENVENTAEKDSLVLAGMIEVREQAMINKDIDTAMSQFSEDITWINSQGYFFEGKQSVLEFHNMLANDNPLDYLYEAGKPRIRITSPDSAIAYYSWKMLWFEKGHPEAISKKEIGLMTLSAQKKDGIWRWIAVTNQHTPWFYEEIETVTID
jgi:uncharacterized protein (TIGR02246 family)